MHGAQARLPGGLLTEDRLERSLRFYPITGSIEQKLLEFSGNRNNSPDYVTEVLSTVVERIGERQPDREDIASLCVADRQYLMIQLSRLLEGDQVWRNYKCKNCFSEFDIPIDRSVLPVKKAGSTFPRAYVQLHGKELKLQVPTGLTQKLISELDDKDAIYVLVSNCLISVDGETPKEDFVRELADEEIALIENALEQASPEVATAVSTEIGRAHV